MDDPGDVHQRDWASDLHFFPAARKFDPVSELRQQSSSGERKMSALRQRIAAFKKPHLYLAIVFISIAAAFADSFRKPANQATAHLWTKAVRLYQEHGRPLLQPYVRCRYAPTCSEYSIQAVETHGIRRGLYLSVKRIQSCRATVPPGTIDPVPSAH
jgi:putative membrane protein insertion efficiency factor